MKTSELSYFYPLELVATSRTPASRVMWVDKMTDHRLSVDPKEVSCSEVLARFRAGDQLVINDSKVLKRRIFADNQEFLFLNRAGTETWEVLFASAKFALGHVFALPGGVSATLVKKGRPQTLRLSTEVGENYFNEYGQLPLPPYIQEARGRRENCPEDQLWYQTEWARAAGSFAAPTASLHFTQRDLDSLRARGVEIVSVTLHIGLGTFLPITSNDLSGHTMHEEIYDVSDEAYRSLINFPRGTSRRRWCLGTTSLRVLETLARGGSQQGRTRLYLYPDANKPNSDLWTDILLTNFHQPGSTLLALVMYFSGIERVKSCYQWAIEKKFRLFSYGDLSVWERR